MTTKIRFKDVIVALKQNAFTINPYPFILTYEMHCSLKGQKRIAEILKEVGDMLYYVPEDYEGHQYYPSLKSLMNKIIIKGKGKLPVRENPIGYELPKTGLEGIQIESSPLLYPEQMNKHLQPFLSKSLYPYAQSYHGFLNQEDKSLRERIF